MPRALRSQNARDARLLRRVLLVQIVAVALGAVLFGLGLRVDAAGSVMVGGLVLLLPQALTSCLVLKLRLGSLGLLATEALRVLLCCLGLLVAAVLLPGLDWVAVVTGLALCLKGPWLVLLMEQMSEKA